MRQDVVYAGCARLSDRFKYHIIYMHPLGNGFVTMAESDINLFIHHLLKLLKLCVPNHRNYEKIEGVIFLVRHPQI